MKIINDNDRYFTRNELLALMMAAAVAILPVIAFLTFMAIDGVQNCSSACRSSGQQMSQYNEKTGVCFCGTQVETKIETSH